MSDRPRHLLSLLDLSAVELHALLHRAEELRELRNKNAVVQTLRGRVLGMIFEKASTRTRVSFEVGSFELGGHAVYLSNQGSQIGRGEPIEDTARVLGRYCHGLVMRTFGHDRLTRLAEASPVPVINGLSDLLHPCQVLADLQTVLQLRGRVEGLRYAWIGDGNNMAHSWIHAAALLGLDLVLACPQGYEPYSSILATGRDRVARLGRGSIQVVREPKVAAARADVVSTDVWASMGQEEEAERRRLAFAGYCVDRDLLTEAAADAIVLHCLPAHRGEEISAEVIDAPGSAVWQQAENRLHVQKALLESFLGTAPQG